jgi:oleate hydratase
VCCAQTAVHELMGTKEKPRDIYMGEHNVKVLVEAFEDAAYLKPTKL